MRSRGAVVFGLIGWLFAVLIQAAPAWAVGNLRLGPLLVHPSFQLTENFDDNVCKTKSEDCPDGRDGSDSVTIFSPGLLLILPLRDHEFQAEYRGVFARYSDLKSENYENNTLRGSLALSFPGGLSIDAEDAWVDGHDPRGFSQNLELDFFQRNTATLSVRYDVGPKLTAAVQYAHFLVDYDETRNDFRDRDDNTIGGTVFYHFLPKTSALVEYSFTSVSFDETQVTNRDSDVQRVLVGLVYEITAKSKGTVKGGYESKDFDASARQDFTGGIVSLGLDHELMPRTLLQAVAERRSHESNIESQDFFTSAGGSLRLIHRFSDKISGTGRVSYDRDKYPVEQTVGSKTDERLDNTWRVGAGLNYWIQEWLNLGGRFDYTRWNSTFDSFEFKDRLYSLSLGLIL